MVLPGEYGFEILSYCTDEKKGERIQVNILEEMNNHVPVSEGDTNIYYCNVFKRCTSVRVLTNLGLDFEWSAGNGAVDPLAEYRGRGCR